MKEKTTPSSASVSPLTWKIFLTAGVLLVLSMLVFTVYSISHALRAASPPTVAEINAGTVSVPPLSSGETSPASVPDSSRTAMSSASQPPTLAMQIEIIPQREKAQMETIEVLKRQAKRKAGTNAVSKEELTKIEQSDPYIQ